MSRNRFRIMGTFVPSLAFVVGASVAADTSATSYGRLLSKYVTPDGVCYDAWRAQPEDVKALSEVIREWSARNAGALTAAERKALFINLYNAKVLEIVLTNAPKASIKEITPGITGFGVFRKSVLTLGGRAISLTELEDRLRQDFNDPRVHFAINCASRSCPPIAAEPYRGDGIDSQLDKSVRGFLASPGAIGISTDQPAGAKTGIQVTCSKIFDWYAKDFEVAGGVLAFLQKYGPPGAATALKTAGGAARTVFQEYDWSLNRSSTCGKP